MLSIKEVHVGARPIESLKPIIGDERVSRLVALAETVAKAMPGAAVWNVNSTERGGGVAEMLQTIVGYARGAGIDCRWAVVPGTPDFFNITKRLHNALHGSEGDGSALGEAEHEAYRALCEHSAAELCALIRPGDVAILHDPQTAGCIELLRKHGARIVWRCHIGTEDHNAETRRGWKFLQRYLGHAEVAVFSRPDYVPDDLGVPTVIIQPTIDPLSPKNQDMSAEAAAAILTHTGIIEGGGNGQLCTFTREDGVVSRVDRRADILRLGPAPQLGDPLVTQISRWDRLKDHSGVLIGFAELLDRLPGPAHLVLAGPNVNAVADDPEGAAVYDEIVAAWRELNHSQRHHVHLINLPMEDVEENAAIVNALQRHATVVVQKSLREGFGLTVAEAMWKARPVVASRVGGIQDQIEHGRTGLLIDDPSDTSQLADALYQVLSDPELGDRLGLAAKEAIREQFLNSTSLEEYGRLLLELGKTG
jgi:trehalose synthase